MNPQDTSGSKPEPPSDAAAAQPAAPVIEFEFILPKLKWDFNSEEYRAYNRKKKRESRERLKKARAHGPGALPRSFDGFDPSVFASKKSHLPNGSTSSGSSPQIPSSFSPSPGPPMGLNPAAQSQQPQPPIIYLPNAPSEPPLPSATCPVPQHTATPSNIPLNDVRENQRRLGHEDSEFQQRFLQQQSQFQIMPPRPPMPVPPYNAVYQNLEPPQPPNPEQQVQHLPSLHRPDPYVQQGTFPAGDQGHSIPEVRQVFLPSSPDVLPNNIPIRQPHLPNTMMREPDLSTDCTHGSNDLPNEPLGTPKLYATPIILPEMTGNEVKSDSSNYCSDPDKSCEDCDFTDEEDEDEEESVGEVGNARDAVPPFEEDASLDQGPQSPTEMLETYNKFVQSLQDTISSTKLVLNRGNPHLKNLGIGMCFYFREHRFARESFYDRMNGFYSSKELRQIKKIFNNLGNQLDNIVPKKIRRGIKQPYSGVLLPGFIDVCSLGHSPYFSGNRVLSHCPVKNCQATGQDKTYFNGMIPYLVNVLNDSKMAKLLRIGPSKKDESVMSSFVQGELFKGHSFEEPGKSDLHVYVSLFQYESFIFSSVRRKFSFFVALIDNLPPSERSKRENRVTVYSYPNCYERLYWDEKTPESFFSGESDVRAFYKIVEDHFKVLSEVGFDTYDASKKETVRVYVHLRTFGGDIPVIASAMGHEGPAAVNPCWYCSVTKSTDSNGKKGLPTAGPLGPNGKLPFYTLYDMQWYLDIVEPALESRHRKPHNEEHVHSTPGGNWEVCFNEDSAMIQINKLSFPYSFPFDPAKIFFENVTRVFYEISTGTSKEDTAPSFLREFRFSKEERMLLYDLIRKANMFSILQPYNFEPESARMARGIFEGVNAAKMEVLCYVMPILHHQMIVSGVPRESYSKIVELWDIFADFSTMIKIANGKVVKKAHLDGIERSFNVLVRDYERMITHNYKDNFSLCTLPIHLCTHAASLIAQVGPLSQYSGYANNRHVKDAEREAYNEKKVVKYIAKHEQMLSITNFIMPVSGDRLNLGWVEISSPKNMFRPNSRPSAYQKAVERQLLEELKSKGLQLVCSPIAWTKKNYKRPEFIYFRGQGYNIKRKNLVRVGLPNQGFTAAGFRYFQVLDMVHCYGIEVERVGGVRSEQKEEPFCYRQNYLVVTALPTRPIYSARNLLTMNPGERLVRGRYWYSSEVDCDKVFVLPLDRVANPAYELMFEGVNDRGEQDKIGYVYDPYVACGLEVDGAIEDVLTQEIDIEVNKYLFDFFKREELGKSSNDEYDDYDEFFGYGDDDDDDYNFCKYL